MNGFQISRLWLQRAFTSRKFLIREQIFNYKVFCNNRNEISRVHVHKHIYVFQQNK